jgi:hypothetical protein
MSSTAEDMQWRRKSLQERAEVQPETALPSEEEEEEEKEHRRRICMHTHILTRMCVVSGHADACRMFMGCRSL